MAKLNLKKYIGANLDNLVSQANQDSDPASIFFLGDGIKAAEGAVIIVKGNVVANKAYNVLCSHKMITPGKKVAG